MARAKFLVYKSDTDGQWRWHLQAENGKIVADSAEGYVNKEDCLHGIEVVKALSLKTATVES